MRRTSTLKPQPFIWNFSTTILTGSSISALYKAHCFLREDRQLVHGDFDPTNVYASVARHETIRMFIAKDAAQNLHLKRADVSNVYLYGIIGKPILMKQLTDSGLNQEMPGDLREVQNSIYGLRQAR